MCIQLACSWRPRAFEEAHRWNIQAKFYNEKFPLVYEGDKIGDSLSWRIWWYFEAQVWKRIVTLSLLYFLSFILFGPCLVFRPLFFRLESHPNLWGNHSLHHPFLTWDNALKMMIITLLFTYNSKLQLKTRTKYDSIWIPLAVYQDVQWSSIAKISNGQAVKISC